MSGLGKQPMTFASLERELQRVLASQNDALERTKALLADVHSRIPPRPVIPEGCRLEDSPDGWIEVDGDLHPVGLGTVRCHARLDDPDGPSFEVVGDAVYTVPGRYCGNMEGDRGAHEPTGVEYAREWVGRIVPIG